MIKVFLCSTYTDLIDERQAVIAVISELKMQHKSIEFFGAKPDRPIDACLAEVANSNVMVVIVGHKYGSLVPGRTISFAEAEYREGQRLEKICLVYMRDLTVPVLPKDFELDPKKLKALNAFCAALNGRHTVARFRAAGDLAETVRSDLLASIHFVEAKRTGRDEPRQNHSALLIELENLVTSALAEGAREALVLSAVRGALADLRRRPPIRPGRIASAWTSFLKAISKSAGEEQPWVFFSYAHPAAPVIHSVARELRKLKVRVWIDQLELVPGDTLRAEIERGLDRASALVFFASKASLESTWARHELDFFLANRLSSAGGPPIIPVLLEDVALPALMRDILYIDMRVHDAREAALRIAATVRHVAIEQIR